MHEKCTENWILKLLFSPQKWEEQMTDAADNYFYYAIRVQFKTSMISLAND